MNIFGGHTTGPRAMGTIYGTILIRSADESRQIKLNALVLQACMVDL